MKRTAAMFVAPALIAMTAQAQTTLASVSLVTQFQYCTPTVAVPSGDRIILEARLRPDPDGGATSLTFSTMSGRRGTIRGVQTWVQEYVSQGGSERMCGQMSGWDSGDVAHLTIRRHERPDYTVQKPVFVDRDTLSFGFRRMSGTNHSGRRVRLSLAFARGGSPLKTVVDRTFEPNSGGETVRVAWRDFGSPPAGTTALLARVDPASEIPEGQESNNAATYVLPNLRAVTIDRDGTDGSLTIRTEVTRGDGFPPNTRPHMLAVASDDNRLSSSASTDIRLFTGNATMGSATLEAQEYPLPRGSNRFVKLVLDPANEVLEASESDNGLVRQLDPLRDWSSVSTSPFVDVFQKRTNSTSRYIVTVVRLEGAQLAQIAVDDRNVSFDYHVAQWNAVSSSNYRTRAVVNGTFFTGHGGLPKQGAPVSFDYGLKVSNKVFSGWNQGGPNTSLFTFSPGTPGTAGIVDFRSTSRDNPQYPDLVGVLNGTRSFVSTNNDKNPLTWVGLRDAVGRGPQNESRFRVALFVTALAPVLRRELVREMVKWGVPPGQLFELDGGGSTAVAVDGKKILEPRQRGLLPGTTLPHSIGIVEFSGRTLSLQSIDKSRAATFADSEPPALDELLARVRENFDSDHEVLTTQKQAVAGDSTFRLRDGGTLVRLDAASPGFTVPMEAPRLIDIAGCSGRLFAVTSNGSLIERASPSGWREDASNVGEYEAIACREEKTLIAGLRDGRVVSRGVADNGTWEALPALGDSIRKVQWLQGALYAVGGSGKVWQLANNTTWVEVLPARHRYEPVLSEYGVLSLSSAGQLVLEPYSRGGLPRVLVGDCTRVMMLGDVVYAACGGGVGRLSPDDTGETLVIKFKGEARPR